MKKKARPMDNDEILISSPDYPPSDGGPFILVNGNAVTSAAGGETAHDVHHTLSVTKDSGTIVVGPFAVCDSPHNIRIGLYNTLNDSLSAGIPSTIATPIPVMNFVNDANMMRKQVEQIMTAVNGMKGMLALLKGAK